MSSQKIWVWSFCRLFHVVFNHFRWIDYSHSFRSNQHWCSLSSQCNCFPHFTDFCLCIGTYENCIQRKVRVFLFHPLGNQVSVLSSFQISSAKWPPSRMSFLGHVIGRCNYNCMHALCFVSSTSFFLYLPSFKVLKPLLPSLSVFLDGPPRLSIRQNGQQIGSFSGRSLSFTPSTPTGSGVSGLKACDNCALCSLCMLVWFVEFIAFPLWFAAFNCILISDTVRTSRESGHGWFDVGTQW